MTRLLIGYDASAAARAALAVASGLFPGADADVAVVGAGATGAIVHEGAELARAAGLRAAAAGLAGISPWRALRAEARRRGADVLVCGTGGTGALERALLGSTASSLVHHLACPLLIVPTGAAAVEGPLVAGYDESGGAGAALRFAAAHLRERRVIVVSGWRSPVRRTLRGRALLHAGATLHDYARGVDDVLREVHNDIAEEGADVARELGLRAQARAAESEEGAARALVETARLLGAAAVLVGSRGRGAAASATLGSVASALVHAAAVPVIVVPGGPAGAPPPTSPEG